LTNMAGYLAMLMWGTGVLVWLYLLYKVVRFFVLRRIYSTGEALVARHKGEWALVTGSSQGLGKAYAIALARRQINVVLAARSENLMQDLAKQLSEQYGVQTRVVVLDAYKFKEDPQMYEKIADSLSDINISILVNNLGGAINNSLGYYLEEPWEDEESTRLLNSVPTQKFIKLLLPKMIERGKGIVINVSSLASMYSVHFSTYSAQKAYLNRLTALLEAQYGSKGIIFQCPQVGAVSTPGTGDPDPSIHIVTAQACAEESLRLLGWARQFSPCLQHALGGGIIGSIPFPSLANKMVGDASTKIIEEKVAKLQKNKRE